MDYESIDLEFPVIVYDGKTPLPEGGIYYVVAGNGLFLHKETGLVSGFVQVKNISPLQDLETKAWVKCELPKLPFEEVYKIKTFFELVVAKYRSEACVILYFNKETQQYRVVATPQTVSHSGVRYDRPSTSHVDGYIPVGTIHSHCDFDAFHSHVDIGDEEDFDGLHITFGNNDKQKFSITASVVVNGTRQKVDPLNFLLGIIPFKDELYAFESPFVVAPEWTKTINEWFEKVRPGMVVSYRKNTDRTLEPVPVGTKAGKGINAGDWADWAENLGDFVSWQSTYGSGPFEIIEIKDDPSFGKVAVARRDIQNDFTVPLSFLEKSYEN